MSTNNASDLSATLRALAAIDRACTVLTVRIAEVARKKGLPLSIEQFYLLHALTLAPDNTLEVSELSGLVYLPRSTISDTILRLEGDGLLVRSTVRHDRRRIQATLTKAGTALVEAWAIVVHDIAERHIFGVLNEDLYASMLSVSINVNVHERLGAFASQYLVDIDEFTPFPNS